MKVKRIDLLSISDHPRLSATDKCFYLREYFSKKGYSYSETNHLIHNFKKSPLRRGRPEWRHKEAAIRHFSTEIGTALPQAWVENCVFVPVPPSKAKGHPEYDDRLLRVLQPCLGGILDVRELIIQTVTTRSAHDSRDRPSVNELMESYQLNNAHANGRISKIIIFDDILTVG